jgi:hypothetical protein
MKELTSTFNALLQDKRVRAEQSKYESITRQRSVVNSKYKRVYQEYLDLEAGLDSAKKWYSEMKDTVDSLDKNVETFVNNRRSEGAQLLSQIEQERASNASGQADRERERLRGLMERMSMDPSTSPSSAQPRSQSFSHNNSTSPSTRYPSTNIVGQYQVSTSPPPHSTQPQGTHPTFAAPQNGFHYANQLQSRPESYNTQTFTPQIQSSYNPGTYPQRDASQPVSAPPTQTQFSQSQYGRPLQATSPPPTQTQFSQNQYGRPSQPISPPATQMQFSQNQYGRPSQATSPPPNQTQFSQNQYGRQQPLQQQYVPHGYVPPPPPPGPPPLGPQQTFQQPGGDYGYGNNTQQRSTQQQGSGDPWAGLNAWK